MHRGNVLIIRLLALFSTCVQVSAQNETMRYVGPSCLGEFCFAVEHITKLITEADLTMRYGTGYSERGKFSYYCYTVPEQHAFVRFRPYHGEGREIMDIFVSDVPSCPVVEHPTTPFQQLVTPEGLKIGDPYDKVLALYGKPNKTDRATGNEKIGLGQETAWRSTPFGETVLIYGPAEDGPLHAEIYLRNRQVAAILISVFP